MNKMENTLKHYFKRDINLLKISYNNFNYVKLTKSEKTLLEDKISKLPYKEKILLYMKYIFDENDSNIKEILNRENPEEDIIFLETLLLSQLGYKESRLDPEVFKNSVENIYYKELEEDNDTEGISHIYSDKFINTMRTLGLEKPRRSGYKFIKKVALFFLIVTLSITVFLGTNSDAREYIMDFFFEDFNGDAIHVTSDLEKERLRENLSIEIGYIPNKYEIFKTHEDLEMLHPFYVFYSSSEDNYLTISAEGSKTTDILPPRTELKNEEKFSYKDNFAYLLHYNEGTIIFYYYDEQIKISLISNEKSISKLEMIKIADGIKIIRK